MNTPAFVTASKPTHRHEALFRPHPGEVLKRRVINKIKLKQPDIAKHIGISAKHLSQLTNGHISITVPLARKLEACTPISAEAWLHYQAQYDLYITAKLEQKTSLLAM